MAQGISLIVYPVTDLSASKSFYRTLLGVDPYVDGSYYVGFRTGELEVGLDPNARGRGITAPIGYVDVADISNALKSLLDAGGQELQPVTNVGGGLRIATVKDPDGNILGVRQHT
jgi:predicted enzyme related to lactoylglutathione lyase